MRSGIGYSRNDFVRRVFFLFLARAYGQRNEKEVPMQAFTPLSGDELLAAVTAALVELHERYHHRPPGSAKTQMLGDDVIACAMGEVFTDVEKTMIELERSPLVKETRSAFQQAMRQRFIDEVERLTGREVIGFISDSHVGPDMEIEVFVLKERGPDAHS